MGQESRMASNNFRVAAFCRLEVALAFATLFSQYIIPVFGFANNLVGSNSGCMIELDTSEGKRVHVAHTTLISVMILYDNIAVSKRHFLGVR